MSLANTRLDHSGRGVGERKLDSTVWSYGQLYVVAQANAGVHGLSNYATAKNSLAVGAAADNGSIAPFSSHGPTADGRLAPNVVGTGVEVVSVRGQGARSGYQTSNGTSMASPSVAGAAALLLDAVPGFQHQPALTRARLMASAVKPDAFMVPGVFNTHNTDGPGSFQNQYGMGLVSARLSVLQRDEADGWTSGAAVSELADGRYSYVDIDVPAGASRLDVVMTWDEAPADAVTDSVLNDLDLWLDEAGDCGGDACGEHSSRSRVDNVEWIVVREPTPGRHRVKIVAERVHGAPPRAALAWTVIRGPSTPQIRVEPVASEVSSSGGQVEIEFTVTVDGYAASGTAVHFGARRGLRMDHAWRVSREDGVSRTDRRRHPEYDPVDLGEIGAGEEQRVVLSYAARGSHRLYLTATAWNGTAGVAYVDVDIPTDDYRPPTAQVPPNDAFADPEVISGESGERELDLMLASREPGEPELESSFRRELRSTDYAWAARASSSARTVWYAWQPPTTGQYSFRLKEMDNGEAPPGATVAVFEGAELASLELIGANNDPAISFNVARGVTYRVRVSTTSHSVRPYRLMWSGANKRPVNDDFADSESLPGSAGEVTGTNLGATLEQGEFFGDLTATVWYTWTAPEDGYWMFEAGEMRPLVFSGGAIGSVRLVVEHS